MNRLAVFFETSAGKRLKNMIIGLGAAIVMMGALFKLQHWPGASAMLIAGLSIEAFIFALQGILPPHKDYYWEKLHPGLDVSPEAEEHKLSAAAGKGKKGSITAQLDEMLEEAQVEQNLIKRLGENLGKLGTSIEQITDLSDAAAATSKYSNEANQAASALAEMKTAYSQATSAVNSLTSSADSTKEYHTQIQQISKNMAALNSVYELELQDTNNHLKAMNKFYGNLVSAMTNMEEAKEDAVKYKDEIGVLAKNLNSLNSVYGRMLTAMAQGNA